MRYRSDIDGLRAVAVIPVVLFHAGYSWLPGGFVGVDIFFVISGYLISTIIMKEISQGNFSYLKFYERRVRRIIPALVIVLFATLLVGYFFLLPDEYTTLAESALAAIAFIPNVYFFDTESTYFGLDIVTSPLLHTWSLGVEEQFYILFPGILVLLFKSGVNRWVALVVVSLLVVSLSVNVLFAGLFTKLTFYMLPTRAWELLAGVALSLSILPTIKHSVIAQLVSLTGLGLIVGAMLMLNERSVFPGINAIYPVLGAVLIIYANTYQQTIVSTLLSSRALVWIGVISYSLYLWHWPVTVYTKMIWDTELSKVFVVIVSVILAVVSYHYVENRYRKRTKLLATGRTLKELGAGLSIVALGSVLIYYNNGLVHRVPEEIISIADAKNYRGNTKDCKVFEEKGGRSRFCRLGDRNIPPRFVVWGDSHALAISPAFEVAAQGLGISGYVISSSGCSPLLGVYRKKKDNCLHFNNKAISFIKENPSIEIAFLVGYWRVPLIGESYDNSNVFIIDDQTGISSPIENKRVFKRGLDRSLEELNNIKAVVVEDIPEIGSQFGKNVANHLARQTWLGVKTLEHRVFRDEVDSYARAFSAIIDELSSNSDFIRIKPALCHDSNCKILSNGELVYSDGDHLSKFGALLLAPIFTDYLRGMLH